MSSPERFVEQALQRAAMDLSYALDVLTPETSYLEGELSALLEQTHVLLRKMLREEVLKKDKVALLDEPPGEEGVLQWIGRPTKPSSE